MSKKKQQAVSLLKHLPAYPILFGWNRGKLARNILKFFIAPDPTDDSPRAQDRRAFIAGYRLDELTRGVTPFFNRMPWVTMLQLGVNFDRLIEFAVELGIDPFKTLPKHVNGLSVSVWGQWIGGLSAPVLHIQEAIDRYFIDNLGPRHHVFMVTPDWRLKQLGYLTDRHFEFKDSHFGDRNLPGGDAKLRLTNLGASFPLFRHSEKSVRYFGDQLNYKIKLDTTNQKYIKKAHHFGVRRYERLAVVRQMARHLEIVQRHKQNIQQNAKEVW